MTGALSVGSLYSSGQFAALCEPDNAPQLFRGPAPDFVLCRDEYGCASAVYGESVWDFNPYRLSAKKIVRVRFDTVFDENGKAQQRLIEEAKYVMYCLIYFAGGGRRGTLSVSTLMQYWFVLRSAIQFCFDQKNKGLVGVISLQQLLCVPVYMASFIRDAKFDKGCFAGILNSLSKIPDEQLGYSVLNPKKFELKRLESNQHPVIPTRIYLGIINRVGDLLDQLYEGVNDFELFVMCFADEYYGLVNSVQVSRGLGGKDHYRLSMPEAISKHGLELVLSGAFSCPYKRSLQRVLINIQFVIKMVIHIYTGMRDQEVLRVPYNCLSDHLLTQGVADDQGVVRDKPQTVHILSTTTKFAGYKQKEKWFAPGEVIRAVEVAQAICRGLARLYKIDLNDRCPLFLNPSIVGASRRHSGVSVTAFGKRHIAKKSMLALPIQAGDLQELVQSDPSRDFNREPTFAIGQPWPLNSHQFRRSLAFYGSSSGFLSLPTLRTQFKHMTIGMARYYTNNYENLRTIFGYYDDTQKNFVLPSNHFAFEYQMAIPMSVANQLIADLLFDEEPLFGGTGSYMQKQKERATAGEIHLEDIRADTIQLVKTGAISYRPTLLGGCTKVGRCDSFLLGDYTECLSCEGAIIKLDKLNSAIEDATVELCNYTEGSGEYQIVQKEIERLTSFKARVAGTARCP